VIKGSKVNDSILHECVVLPAAAGTDTSSAGASAAQGNPSLSQKEGVIFGVVALVLLAVVGLLVVVLLIALCKVSH